MHEPRVHQVSEVDVGVLGLDIWRGDHVLHPGQVDCLCLDCLLAVLLDHWTKLRQFRKVFLVCFKWAPSQYPCLWEVLSGGTAGGLETLCFHSWQTQTTMIAGILIKYRESFSCLPQKTNLDKLCSKWGLAKFQILVVFLFWWPPLTKVEIQALTATQHYSKL